MDKLKKCHDFANQLKEWNIEFKVFNSGYQIQYKTHFNFYPSKGVCYNDDTGEKKKIPEFKNKEHFLQWTESQTPLKVPEINSKKITEQEYCNVEALGIIRSAQQVLSNLVLENVPVLNTEEFRNARAVIFKSSDKLFEIIKINSDEV